MGCESPARTTMTRPIPPHDHEVLSDYAGALGAAPVRSPARPAARSRPTGPGPGGTAPYPPPMPGPSSPVSVPESGGEAYGEACDPGDEDNSDQHGEEPPGPPAH